MPRKKPNGEGRSAKRIGAESPQKTRKRKTLPPSSTRPPKKASAPRPIGRRPLGQTGDVRETIFAEAISVMSERGLDGVTIKEIALRSRLSTGMIHYHFQNKQTLIESTLDRHFKPISNYVWEAVDLDIGPLEMLKEVFMRLQKIIRDNPWYLGFWGREMGNVNNQVMRNYMYSLVSKKRLTIFVKKIEEGQKLGLINPILLPELVFANFLASSNMTRLFQQEWSREFNKEFSDEMVSRHIWGLVLDGLAAKGGGKLQ
jgi:AcrR family transcriptional regulator